MEATVKKTKKDYFMELKDIVAQCVEDEDEQAELTQFIEDRLAELEKRKADAAKRAEKKKAESDELTEEIFGLIGDELATVDEVVIALNDEEITRAKVTARLGKLVREGRIVKEDVKVDGKKRMAYRLPAEAEVEAE